MRSSLDGEFRKIIGEARAPGCSFCLLPAERHLFLSILIFSNLLVILIMIKIEKKCKKDNWYLKSKDVQVRQQYKCGKIPFYN